MNNIVIRPMTISDVDSVHEIEVGAFSRPWSHAAFVRETTQNMCARYLVIERDGEILGYAGMWLVLDEAHVMNVAIREDARGEGLGFQLMRELVQLAADTGMTYMTLECRRSNVAAQALYRKLGFVDLGYRKKYYEDDGEDALIMALTELPEGRPENDPFLITEDEI